MTPFLARCSLAGASHAKHAFLGRPRLLSVALWRRPVTHQHNRDPAPLVADDEDPPPVSNVASPFDGSSKFPPALFVQKHDRLLDPTHLTPAQPGSPAPEVFDECTKPQVEDFVQRTRQSTSFPDLVHDLLVHPHPLFAPPIALTQNGDPVFKQRPAPLNATPLGTDDPPESELMRWKSSQWRLSQLPGYYLMLSKSRLSLLVVLTAAAGYGIAPGAFVPATFALSTLGVGLISASANTVNQILEVPFDSQMKRTQNRVLVRGLLSTQHAAGFALATGATGIALLGHFVNPTAALIGAFNLFLYTSVYTPMKRMTIANTWVGSIVGALPPIIGWVSCTGSIDPGCLIPAGILFTWQFPHFNALSWNLRPDYSRAGYRMMAATDPELCKRVTVRHAWGCLLVCLAAPYLDVTSTMFLYDSLLVNLILVYLSTKFYYNANSESSRKLFKYTLIHLPVLMMFMFIAKKSKTAPETTKDASALSDESGSGEKKKKQKLFRGLFA